MVVNFIKGNKKKTFDQGNEIYDTHENDEIIDVFYNQSFEINKNKFYINEDYMRLSIKLEKNIWNQFNINNNNIIYSFKFILDNGDEFKLWPFEYNDEDVDFYINTEWDAFPYYKHMFSKDMSNEFISKYMPSYYIEYPDEFEDIIQTIHNSPADLADGEIVKYGKNKGKIVKKLNVKRKPKPDKLIEEEEEISKRKVVRIEIINEFELKSISDKVSILIDKHGLPIIKQLINKLEKKNIEYSIYYFGEINTFYDKIDNKNVYYNFKVLDERSFDFLLNKKDFMFIAGDYHFNYLAERIFNNFKILEFNRYRNFFDGIVGNINSNLTGKGAKITGNHKRYSGYFVKGEIKEYKKKWLRGRWKYNFNAM
jgi:hypothetical protein